MSLQSIQVVLFHHWHVRQRCTNCTTYTVVVAGLIVVVGGDGKVARSSAVLRPGILKQNL